MINPLLTHGRVLFVKSGCDYCNNWKKFIYRLNTELKLNKRILIIDCTLYQTLGIMNPIIRVFEDYLEDYPTLFIEGEMKIGAQSVLECKAWLIARLRGDFILDKMPEYLEEIDKYTLFNLDCRKVKGRIVCERLD